MIFETAGKADPGSALTRPNALYWNGTVVNSVSLYASSILRRSALGITTFTSVRSGTLTIRT